MNRVSTTLILSAFLLMNTSYAGIIAKPKKKKKTYVVAVIDTGISDYMKDGKFLCKFGHKDFTGTGLNDTHGHGTHVSGLIHRYAARTTNWMHKSIDYCQVIIKYWDPKQGFSNPLKQSIASLQYAIDIKVDMINYSSGGESYSHEEELLIKKALDLGIKVVVAAGNESKDISKNPYYPAVLDSRLIIVGNLSQNKVRAPSSNYGSKVNAWEFGENVVSWSIDGTFTKLTGTSQATAIKSGKLIGEMLTE